MRARTAATRAGVGAGVGRHAGARLADQHGALLRFLELRASSSLTERRSFQSLALKLSDRRQYMTPFIRRCFSRISARSGSSGCAREIVLDALQARPGLLLLGRAQGRDVVGFFDFVDARFEIHALLRQSHRDRSPP